MQKRKSNPAKKKNWKSKWKQNRKCCARFVHIVIYLYLSHLPESHHKSMSQISFHIADHQTETMLYQFCMWIWIFPVECKRHCHYCAQQHLSDKCHQIPRQRYFLIRKNQNIYWINSNLIHNYRNYIKYSMLKIRRFSRSLASYVFCVCVCLFMVSLNGVVCMRHARQQFARRFLIFSVQTCWWTWAILCVCCILFSLLILQDL